MNDRLLKPGSMSRRELGTAILTGAVVGTTPSANAAATAIKATLWEDQQAIEALTSKFAIALDERDPQAWGSCFVAGALPAGSVTTVMAFNAKYHRTMHRVCNHAYSIRGESATGGHYSIVSYVKAVGGKLRKFDVYARYHEDELVKRDNQWLFVKRNWQPIFSTEEVTVIEGTPQGYWDGLR